jgi:glycine dehydrogenase subunit 1
MDYVANREQQIETMLKELGIADISELFVDIPKNLLRPKPIADDGLSEMEGLNRMKSLAEKNSYSAFDSYLGAGAYEHYVPAIVSAICSKSEFLTAYTPYQAEASQGMLQAMFEFQSMISALTGMDAANSSLYDGASACAEALLMAVRAQKNHKVAVLESIHPHYLAVIRQYLEGLHVELEIIACDENGVMKNDSFLAAMQKKPAAILFSYPNFFGVIEENLKTTIALAKSHSILTIVSANPMVYGLFASAKELGADIAVGDCQPFGISLQFGGPYAGYIACREPLIRQLPGRLVGESATSDGEKAYILTLQAREQHIRREKATSNICTNQALAALASLIAMAWYGKEGLHKIALTVYQRTAYLKSLLQAIPSLSVAEAIHFNEFVVEFPFPPETVMRHFQSHGIIPGIHLKKFFSEKEHAWLVAVTETKSIAQLKHYAEVAELLS